MECVKSVRLRSGLEDICLVFFLFYFLLFGLNAFVRSCLDLNDLTYISFSLDKYESKNEMVSFKKTKGLLIRSQGYARRKVTPTPG